MGVFNYVRPSDNLAAASATTPSVSSGTEDSDYPAANLGDKNVAKPAKLTTTTGRWVLDLGSALEVQAAALINTNLDGGLANVNLEANSSDAWGAPPLSQAFTIPSADQDGRALNPWIDLTGVSPRIYRYWSIEIGTANSAAVAIGEVILGATLRQFSKNFRNSVQDQERHPIIEHRTHAGVSLIYQIGSRWRTIDMRWQGTAQDATDVRSLQRDAAGRGEAFLVLPDAEVNDAWLVRVTADTAHVQRTRPFASIHNIDLSVEEVSAGVVL